MLNFLEFIFFKIFKIFGLVMLSNDSSSYDRFVWLKKNLIMSKENGKLLDIGCGNGWGLFLACELNYKVFGLSYSEDDINKLLKKAPLINETKFEAFVADARNLNKIYETTNFDVVLNLENIEHIINCKKLIKDISNKLIHGGLLYLTTPNLLGKNLIGDSVVKEFPVEDGSHVVRGYSLKRIEKLLNENNLYIISKSYLTGPFSIFLINLDRIFNFLYLRILIFPFIITANLLDRIFFKNHENNLTLALVIEKID
jgi:2-polyprenyl-3-methyl-5-hydroxy-6-metoxy-1,4-benzoquinol methylase